MKQSILYLSLLVLGCSQINTKEQAYYQQQKTMRHGITQIKANVSEVTLPKETQKNLVQLGEQIYFKDCARCHGNTGEGDGPEAKSQKNPPVNLKLAVKTMKRFDFYFSISQMDGSMPGWDQPYSDNERKAIAAYLKTL